MGGGLGELSFLSSLACGGMVTKSQLAWRSGLILRSITRKVDWGQITESQDVGPSSFYSLFCRKSLKGFE